MSAVKTRHAVPSPDRQTSSYVNPREEFPETKHVVEILTSIVQETRRTNALLEQLLNARPLRKSSRLSEVDRGILEALLPGIAGKCGSHPFLISEILADTVLQDLTRNRNSRKLGHLFARSRNENVAGYTIEKLATERGVTLWRVIRGL
jgi:hypothetical protein